LGESRSKVIITKFEGTIRIEKSEFSNPTYLLYSTLPSNYGNVNRWEKKRSEDEFVNT
jgi:hypothetical protein